MGFQMYPSKKKIEVKRRLLKYKYTDWNIESYIGDYNHSK